VNTDGEVVLDRDKPELHGDKLREQIVGPPASRTPSDGTHHHRGMQRV